MIQTIGIIGLGAVGGMYADLLRRQYDCSQILCIADADRIRRYRQDGVYCNGKRLEIRYVPAEEAPPVDLLIFAAKYYSLQEAMDSAVKAVGPDTIVMSFLNGVVSEKNIADRLHSQHLLYTTVQGMDAGKDGNQITYRHSGTIAFGEADGRISEDVLAVREVLENAGISYVNPPDMKRQLYNKWMANVGVNQVCAYYACGYRGVQPGGRYRDIYIAAMEEARACANAEGVGLTEEDVDHWIAVMDSLAPDGEPSMRQDTKAGRPTEAGLFCGTVTEIAARHGIDVPVNRMFCEVFMKENIDKNGYTEKEAIERFRNSNYPRPSLTADIAVFAEQEGVLRLLMIRRGGHPFLGCWALPGGFAEEGETIEQSAARELEEETGVKDLSLSLVGIYSTPGRDPRGWTVSAAYTVLLSDGMIKASAGDDAAEAAWIEVRIREGKTEILLPDSGRLAFDHEQIISDAVNCLLEKGLLRTAAQEDPQQRTGRK